MTEYEILLVEFAALLFVCSSVAPTIISFATGNKIIKTMMNIFSKILLFLAFIAQVIVVIGMIYYIIKKY